MMDETSFDVRPKVKKHRMNILPQNPESTNENKAVGVGRFPSWLHRNLPRGDELWKTSRLIQGNRLHTVCEEAKCPNLLECYSKKTATFLTMGKECTRNCGFCDIGFSKHPLPLDSEEPFRIAESVKQLGLKHVVITMVARDDLEDGGASHLVNILQEVRKTSSEITLEVLTSDFSGNIYALDLVLSSQPDIFNHNIETVRALTPNVRHKATYDRSLDTLRYIKKRNSLQIVKSGLMVGLGETKDQVYETLQDLKQSGCDIVTIGQYLQPSRNKLLVKAFIHPDQFKDYEIYGQSIGIPYVYSGPFIRSSYNANMVIKRTNEKLSLISSH